MVLGALYDADGERLIRLGAEAGTQLACTGGQSLIDEHWGRYVAFIVSAGGLRVVRDPSAGVPAYAARYDRIDIIFSNIEDVERADLLEVAFDPTFMAAWLAFPYLRTSRTGLSGVTEILPGTAIDLNGRSATASTLWRPQTFARNSVYARNRADAVEQVRRAVLLSVGAQAQHAGRVLLELSGGLDSSLIATCLAAEGHSFDSINLATEADGDERRYAQIVASATGSSLHEEVVAPGDGGLWLPSRRLRPGVDPSLRVLDRAFDSHAAASGTDTLFSGTGGDNIFCYTKSAGPVLDALHGSGPAQAWRTGHDVADLCSVTLWTVARATLRRARRRPIPWPRNLDFLSAGVAPEMSDPHPWIAPPGETPSGKRDHIAALLRIQHFLDTAERTHRLPVIYPLLAQPVVEACLGIPTWMWVDRGRNRAVVRDAFADLLPPAILTRMSKGRLRSFCHRSYVDNRPTIADLLLGGLLAKSGLIDLQAVEAYLKHPGDPPDDRYFRISDLVNLELWARSWDA